jgi:diguanylate cyclase (GGDEF)-like protein
MDGESTGARAGELAGDGREVCCSMTSVVLRLVRGHGGEHAVADLLARARSARTAAFLESSDNWVTQDEVADLLTAAKDITGDPAFPRRVGEETVNQHAGKQVATVLRSLGSVESVLQAVAQTASKLSTTTEMTALHVEPGHARVRAAACPGFVRSAQNCELTTGLLTSAPGLFGLPQARVHELECQAQGGEQCLYEVSWDAEQAAAASDPQQRVTALEAQLLAMSERLHAVYEIASDLVSTEDLDAVLRRIVERAADAARAPSHILAVRPDESAQLLLYGRGIDEREARRIARATLAGEHPPGISTLVVDVDSGRRHYGQLLALYPGSVEFFPQEREVLGLYAKHAAAVLDMAFALHESALRHEQVSSLLALSHALASAGTSIEVAERLAAAAPEVIDCDRMRVWLWDGQERRLRSVAAWAREGADAHAQLTIAEGDTPDLQRMLSDPQPLFFDERTDEPFTRALMDEMGVVALTVVPIIVRESFLGVLTAAVTERPERLLPDGDLLQRLTGVAALAAPAMQNGQLVDQLRYKASHDGLTGLLNRVGFRQSIDRALARGGEHGRAGLLFVDLDGFKRVNDLHGHDSGDELIRLAAARLRSVCRGEDEVARLGGDEFAVILTDVADDAQVRAAEARVRNAFVEPFLIAGRDVCLSASVGGGVWPQDGGTVRELVRHADAAMYEDKARVRRAPVLGAAR